VGWLQQHYEGIGIAIAVVAVVLAWLQLRKKEVPTTSVKHSQVNHSPIISGSHNQVVIRHQSSTPVQLEPPKREHPVPNLVYAGSEQKRVYIGRWEFEGICDPDTEEQRTDAVTALVLKFENRLVSDRKIGRAMNVIAKMRFLLTHGNTVSERSIDYGVWINSPCNSTDFGVGDTRELALLSLIADKLYSFRDKRTDNRKFGSEVFSYLEEVDVGMFDRVEITVIDQTSQANLSNTFNFSHRDRSFYIAPV
jgi:hypothetical protein